MALPIATTRSTCPPRYIINIGTVGALWVASMTTSLHALLGTGNFGTIALNLLINSLALATYANCDINLRHFFAVFHEEKIHPLHPTTPATLRG
jgi:hypothetical protein